MSTINKIIKGILITVLIIAIISVIYLVVIHNPGEGFTEFYILDANGNTTDYPVNVSKYSIEKINIGIKNHENMEDNYTVKIKKEQELIYQYNLTLKDNQNITIPYYMDCTNIVGDNQQLFIELYKGNISSPYRILNLRFNVTNT